MRQLGAPEGTSGSMDGIIVGGGLTPVQDDLLGPMWGGVSGFGQG